MDNHQNNLLVDLLLSPSARGYFHKAISQSGSALNHLFYQPEPASIARRLAAELGLSPNLSTAQLVDALRAMSPDQLTGATSVLLETVTREFSCNSL